MKKLLFFLFLLTFAFSAGAQCTSYIADNFNSDQSLTLSAFSDDSSGIQIQSYQWSTGTSGASVTVQNAGVYCVTVTFDNGCSSSDCYTWDGTVPGGPGGGSGCGVDINISIDPNTVYATPYPAGPVTYLWNTGATTSSIPYTTGGLYCVTITTANGCVDDTCNYVDFSQCLVTISNFQGGLSANAPQQSGGGAPQFLWSTGATTSSIQPTVSGNYCVTMTDASGCTATACSDFVVISCTIEIYQLQDLLMTHALSFDGSPTYLWNTGETTSSIHPTASGNYCVTTTDATGCAATDCFDFFYVTPPTDQCFATLTHLPVTGQIYAGYGDVGLSNTFTIEWSDPVFNGMQIIEAGYDWTEMCITITSTTGCVATACINNEYQDDCLLGIITETSFSKKITLTAVGPHPGTTFLWSTGETTQSIIVTEAGDYTVSVADPAGCSDSHTQAVYASNSLQPTFCIGNSTSTADENLVGELFLIQYDPAQGGILTEAAHVETVNGENFFRLENIPDGEYLMKAAILPSSSYYSQYLPTYYARKLLWSEAKVIKFPILLAHDPIQWYSSGMWICLNEGQNPGGPGFIGGLVSEGANATGGADDRDEGDPMAGMSALLQTMDSIDVVGALTDVNGQFGFDNLAWGTYRLTIDVPGLEPVVKIITIGPDSASLNINISVDFVNGTTAIQEHSGIDGVQVFPNPVNDVLNIQLKTKALVRLTNASGQIFHTSQMTAGSQKISTQDLPAGIYFLQVQGELGGTTVKVVKK